MGELTNGGGSHPDMAYAYCGTANEHPHVFRELIASPNTIIK